MVKLLLRLHRHGHRRWGVSRRRRPLLPALFPRRRFLVLASGCWAYPWFILNERNKFYFRESHLCAERTAKR